ncbi:putative The fantastic four family protein [Helianthus anomalus]
MMQASDLGDHIGMESCIDLNTESYTALSSINRKPWALNKRRASVSNKNTKKLPPPMPMLTSTVLKRYNTEDGRLVIVEEANDNPSYRLTAHRSNGRLTLQLTGSESSCYDNSSSGSKATGPCSFVEQNQLHNIRPVKI